MKKVALIILCLGMFLVGLLTGTVIKIEKADAGKVIQYKITFIKDTDSKDDIEKMLNTHANQGWKLHSQWGVSFIFER